MKNLRTISAGIVPIAFVVLLVLNSAQHSANHWCNAGNCEGATYGGHLKTNCPLHSDESTDEDRDFWCLTHKHNNKHK